MYYVSYVSVYSFKLKYVWLNKVHIFLKIFGWCQLTDRTVRYFGSWATLSQMPSSDEHTYATAASSLHLQRWGKMLSNCKRQGEKQYRESSEANACTWPYELWTPDMGPVKCYHSLFWKYGRPLKLHGSVGGRVGINQHLMFAWQYWHDTVFSTNHT